MTAIFAKLGLDGSPDQHRRVRAVLTLLRAQPAGRVGVACDHQTRDRSRVTIRHEIARPRAVARAGRVDRRPRRRLDPLRRSDPCVRNTSATAAHDRGVPDPVTPRPGAGSRAISCVGRTRQASRAWWSHAHAEDRAPPGQPPGARAMPCASVWPCVCTSPWMSRTSGAWTRGWARAGGAASSRRPSRRALDDEQRWELIESAIGSVAGTAHDWDTDTAGWVRAQRHADVRRVG